MALILSAAAHFSVFLTAILRVDPTFELPALQFELAEVELLDPDALRGGAQAPAPPPAGPPDPANANDAQDKQNELEAKKRREEEAARKEAERAAKEAAEKQKKRREARKKRKEQRKNFAAKNTQADQLGPPTSTFHLLLVPKKIRRLPFAETAFSLLEPWPDFDFLVRKGGLDPLKDFNHIVIASPNITNALDTFLAVDYTASRARIVKAIERAVAAQGQVIEWIDDGGFLRGNPRPKNLSRADVDKRWFVFHPDKKVAMFVREAFLDQILQDSDGPVGEQGSARAYVDNLTRLREFAAEQPLSGMQLKVSDIRNAVSGLDLPFPTPDLIEVSVEAARAPIMVVKFGFVDVVEAKSFAIWYEEKLEAELIRSMGSLQYTLGAKAIFQGVRLTRKDATVALRSQFTQGQIELVLGSLAGYTKSITDNADRQRGRRRRAKQPPSRQTTNEGAGG